MVVDPFYGEIGDGLHAAEKVGRDLWRGRKIIGVQCALSKKFKRKLLIKSYYIYCY